MGVATSLARPRCPRSRKADLEQSDGEEDFYYTELDVDVDSLTDGLSSLTPVSPTSSVPPAFPGHEAPVLPNPDPVLGAPPAPPGLCHVHTDHAYQVWGWGGCRCHHHPLVTLSCDTDCVLYPQGCPAPPRPPVPPATAAPPPPKPPSMPR